MAMVKTRSKQ